jgi:hypothetical protein
MFRKILPHEEQNQGAFGMSENEPRASPRGAAFTQAIVPFQRLVSDTPLSSFRQKEKSSNSRKRAGGGAFSL